MESTRFDALSRFLAMRQSRRAAVVGGGAALIGLAGVQESRAQGTQFGLGEDGICRMAFESTVRFGPTLDTQNAPTISGILQLKIGDNGGIGEGTSFLELDNGVRFPVVGQAPGQSIALRISLGERTIVAVGVGDHLTRECAGTFSGRSIGPAEGDLGDWTATGGDQPATATTTAVPATSSGGSSSGGSSSGGSSSGSGSQSGGQPTKTPCTLTASDCSDLFFDEDKCLCICQNTGEPICGTRCCTGGAECVNGTDCVCPGGVDYCEGHCLGCPAGATCQNELCVCPPLSYYCDTNNSCVPCQEGRTYDPNDCSCTTNCPGALGAVCNGNCVDLAIDPANCGACGNACGTNATCSNGACACNAGWTLCGSECLDLMNDRTNCGACANQCGAFDSCIAGVCG